MADELNQDTNTSLDDRVLDAVRAAAAANPSSIPPQFNGDVEKYINAYKELQSDYTKKSQELASLKKQITTSSEKKNDDPPAPLVIKDAEVVEEEDKVTVEDLAAEFYNTGTVSDESKAKAMKFLKIQDSSVLDVVIQGFQFQRQMATNRAVEIAGSTEEYNNILKWASKNLTPAQKEAINSSLSSPSWELTFTGLVAQYRNSIKSSSNNPIHAPVGAPNTEVIPYRSHEEYMADLANPKYRFNTDPDFVNLVMQRAKKTQELHNS